MDNCDRCGHALQKYPTVITSLLDTDMYKYTMMQAIYHQFLGVHVTYEFICRSGEDLRPYMEEINKELYTLCLLRLTQPEIDYLSRTGHFKDDFLRFLRNFKLDINAVNVISDDNKLRIIVEGPWLQTVLFEVPILAIVNEVYFRNTVKDPDYKSAMALLDEKIEIVKNNATFKFAEFGTRRRFSKDWQYQVISELHVKLTARNFVGTSNLFLAKERGLLTVGTMAHEWIQAGQQLTRLRDSQNYMLQKWADEYRGSLGIALTDTIGIDAFLRDFDLYFAKLYDGVRHDSGDPFIFASKVLLHYERLGIDPKTKTIIFSDGLDFKKAEAILSDLNGAINVSFGIGTNLTNDFPGAKPLSIVLKMQTCDGGAVAKISDEPGKSQCPDYAHLNLLRKVFA